MCQCKAQEKLEEGRYLKSPLDIRDCYLSAPCLRIVFKYLLQPAS